MNDTTAVKPIASITVSGTAHQRGMRVGEAMREKVAHSLNTYQQLFSVCDIPWAQAVDKAMGYFDQVQQLSPGFIEELQGVADGSGNELESLFALNSRTEILPPDFLTRVMADVPAQPGAAPDAQSAVFANECTSFACSGDADNIWLAQNWDWCGLQRDAMNVIDATSESGHRYITVTEAGMLAKIGINSSGFAVTLNILRTGEDGQRSGIPVHVLLRVLLDCHSVQEARDVMAGLSFSSSSNIMVADKTGDVASFELSPLGCKVLEPADGYLCHTNHFLDEALAVHDVGRPGNQSTIKRLHKARQRVTDSMSFEQIQSVLCDESDGIESICRLPDPSLPPIACIETVCAVIMNTSQGTLAVSGAQPSISEFKHYSLG